MNPSGAAGAAGGGGIVGAISAIIGQVGGLGAGIGVASGDLQHSINVVPAPDYSLYILAGFAGLLAIVLLRD